MHVISSQATLVICPASLLGQWEGEAKKRVRPDHLRVLVYHGGNRGQSAKSLARYDLVVTTYGTVMSEMKSVLGGKDEQKKSLDDFAPATDDLGKEGT